MRSKLETAVHDWVCDGKISLRGAQTAIASNWEALYKRVFGGPLMTRSTWSVGVGAVVAAVASSAAAAAASPHGTGLPMGYSALAALPTVAPPPRSGVPMRWSREPASARRLASASEFAAGRAVVGLVRAADATALLKGQQVSLVASEPALRAVEIAGSASALATFAHRMGAVRRVRYVEPVESALQEHQRTDPYSFQLDAGTGRPYEWQFAATGMDRALNIAKGDPSILVGIDDTGWADIPDLRGKVAESWYFTTQGSNATDTEGHGTFVASLIAANDDDGVGIAGFCGACRVVPFKDVVGNSFTFAAAVQRLVTEHVRVINLSLEFPVPTFIIADALQSAISAGVLPVISSGNDSASSVAFPASYVQPDNGALGYGLAVGASDINGNRASFSNWGSRLSLLAPGSGTGDCNSGVFGALPPTASLFADGSTCGVALHDSSGNQYAYWNGTSFAAPEVAGVAALVWATNLSLTNAQVANILEQSATRPAGSGWQPDRGWGVLNAAAAVEMATGRSSADALTLGPAQIVGTLKPGGSAALTTSAAWSDQATVVSGTIDCSYILGGATIGESTGTLTNGSGSCPVTVPVAAAGKTLTIQATVTSGTTSASTSASRQVAALPHVQPAKKKSRTQQRPKKKR